MPWECKDCQTQVLDSQLECPSCQAPKTAWSLHDGLTRNFVVSGRKVHFLSGNWHQTFPAEEATRLEQELWSADQPLWEKGFVSAVRKHDARVVIERGEQAPTHETLFVRVNPGAKKEVPIELSVEFELEPEPGVHTLTAPVPEDLPQGGAIDVPFLLVYGEGDLPEDPFPGVHVIDVSEEGEDGQPTFAPAIRISALGKKAKELEVRDAGALELGSIWLQALDAYSGEPVANTEVEIWPSEFPTLEEPSEEEAEQEPEEDDEELEADGLFSDIVAVQGNLAEGSEGPAVRELQLALGQLGKEVAVDGAFGPETKSALTALQQEHGLAADGIVGPSTGAALDYLLLEEVDPLELREDWQVARTDDEGVLHLPRFPLGYATVKLSGYEAQSLPVLDDGPASADGAAAEPEAEEEPEEPYLLMLRPELGVARVHVLDGDGLPVGSLAYELASDSVHRAGTLSPSGELLEERLPLGYYELSVRGRGSASVPTVGSRWAAPHVLVVGPDLMGGDLDDDDTEEERNG